MIVIVGPTAVGKSSLAMALAQRFGGEIVNADSRQVYRYMDIGTAKPTARERAVVVHHLLDIVTPDQDFSLATYQRLASKSITGIHARGLVPLLVGGTGQYIRAVVEGWQVPRVAPDLRFRDQLAREVAVRGGRALYTRLERLDPQAAAQIHPHNTRRVVRALEVIHTTGCRFSELQRRETPPYSILQLGLTMERDRLYERIDHRVDDMIAQGLVAEVEDLLRRGYGLDLPAMSSIGYREIGQHLRGNLELSKAIELTKFETHRYARQQYTWFRLKDPHIRWFDAGFADTTDQAIEAVTNFLSSGTDTKQQPDPRGSGENQDPSLGQPLDSEFRRNDDECVMTVIDSDDPW